MTLQPFWFSHLRFPVHYPGLSRQSVRRVWWTGIWGVQVGRVFVGVVRSEDRPVVQP